jgi:hypothetical protein
VVEYEQMVMSGNPGRPAPGAPHLYAFLAANMLLNGSETHAGMKAAALTFGDYLNIAKKIYGK